MLTDSDKQALTRLRRHEACDSRKNSPYFKTGSAFDVMALDADRRTAARIALAAFAEDGSCEPMAWAVMHSDGDYDYRLFGHEDEAEYFAADHAVEIGDEPPEIVPLYPLKLETKEPTV